jgi:NAD(P)-dependent dehydrogenase (short-subunit alcohol dehydrogenase family)
MNNIVVVTGASIGFGALTSRALPRVGHTIYASVLETTGRNEHQVKEVEEYAIEHGVDLHAIELNVSSQESIDVALKTIISENGRLDLVIHNAGHMGFGSSEAFTPKQLAQLYDTNLLSTQRVNRAALTHFRKQRKGLVDWVSSSGIHGGTPPYLAPYFAAKAAMDSLAVSCAS